jgi:hypothetical protein
MNNSQKEYPFEDIYIKGSGRIIYEIVCKYREQLGKEIRIIDLNPQLKQEEE